MKNADKRRLLIVNGLYWLAAILVPQMKAIESKIIRVTNVRLRRGGPMSLNSAEELAAKRSRIA